MSAEACVITAKISNNEVSCGVFAEGELVASWSIALRQGITADEAEASLRSFLLLKEAPQPNGAILASVVPAATPAWRDALHAVSASRVLEVGPGLKSGLSIGYRDPSQLGADRVACAVAARNACGNNVIVVDFGSATTITVVDAKGTLVGGAIAPGITAEIDSLALAAQLTSVGVRAPKAIIGRSTQEGIQSGVMMGEAFRVDGLIEAMWAELGGPTALVATGRYAELICVLSAHDFQVFPNLAIQGLYDIWKLWDEGRK